MARVTVVADTGETRSPYTVVNSLITDYVSQTDTTAQTRASDLTKATGRDLSEGASRAARPVKEVSRSVNMHPDFERILGLFLKRYGSEAKAKRVLYLEMKHSEP